MALIHGTIRWWKRREDYMTELDLEICGRLHFYVNFNLRTKSR